MFYIDLYRENMKNHLVSNHKAYNIDIWYVASLCLWTSSTKFVQIISLGPKMTTAGVTSEMAQLSTDTYI